MNKDLLFQLYAIHSPSGREKKMRKFIKRYIHRECGECEIVQDAYGNLLVTKGVSVTYPCLASHIDQVQEIHSKDFSVIEIDEDAVIGWSPKCHEQQGLGADDKNGIFICLELLKEFDVMKCAFFVGEEVGCVGSRAVDLGFFRDCRFIIEPDRMNGHDLITNMFCGPVCSEEFIKAIHADSFGYKEEHGSITDVGTLVERGVGISCLNLSCGYYNAHTSKEITLLSELVNCLDCVRNIVKTCVDVYPFDYNAYISRSYPMYSNKTSKGYSDDSFYYDYYDDYYVMEDIVLNDPFATFEEVYDEWKSCFHDSSRSNLLSLYTEIKETYSEGDSCWDEWEEERHQIKSLVI